MRWRAHCYSRTWKTEEDKTERKRALALHRALRRIAGLVFLLVFWVLAGACQRYGVGGFIVQFIIITAW